MVEEKKTEAVSQIINSYVNTVNVFPNPSQNSFTFVIKQSSPKPITVKITDVNGKVVFVGSIPPFTRHFTWNAQSENSGVYYYQLTNTETEFFTGKLVKY